MKKQNGVTKKVYEYLHLVESVRTKEGPRQRLILNLGVNLAEELHPSQYKTLARRIEDILTGQRSLFELDSTIEKHANSAAKKIFKKRSQEISSVQKEEYKDVDTNSFEVENPRTIGPEYVCHHIWNELKIPQFMRDNNISENIQPLIEAIVIGRLIDAGSEYYTKSWAEKRSAIYELTKEPLRNSLNSYYRAGDALFALKEKLEKYLRVREKDLFNLKEKMYFIDLTNTFFEGRVLKNPKAKFGRSKERRKDCKLVTLGLIIDESGFAKYSELFDGNQVESETLSSMIEKLSEKLTDEYKDKTIVIDAGIATKDNIDWLKENKYHYVVVNRGKPPIDIDYDNMKVIKEDVKQGIKIEVKRFKYEKEIYLVCKSEKKEKKEKSMQDRIEKLFIERLKYYKEGLSKPYRTKKYHRILEMIGRLKEKYSKVSKLYNVKIIPENNKLVSDTNVLSVDIKWSKKSETYLQESISRGTYILHSDRIELSDKEIWGIYTMLTQIEEAFKNMKSHLGFRPNFHQLEKRIDTHIFISVIAYHILHIIEYRLHSEGDHRSWKTICNILKTHERVSISYKVKTPTGEIIKEYLRINSKLEQEHSEIYNKLKLSGNPMPKKIMISK